MNKIMFTADAFEDYVYWQAEDRKTLKRINALIVDILRNGYEGIGKPEMLKGDYQGLCSRRIDDKNRIIYKIVGDVVVLFACRMHYKDK